MKLTVTICDSFWWPNGDIKQEPKEYRMKVHLFGATSSPGCASHGFKHMASNEKKAYPSAARFITHDSMQMTD